MAPGFMMPWGSSSALIACMTSSRTGIAVAFEIGGLEPPHPVFRAERAARLVDEVVDGSGCAGRDVGEITRRAARRREEVVVQVAVAQMPEGVDAQRRQRRHRPAGAVEEAGDF
jgi:hypothetical protein